METEVGQAAYQTCVVDKGCANSSVEQTAEGDNLPMAVTYYEARQFCRRYGGDLPTPGQWMRAAQVEPNTFGIRQLTHDYSDCLSDQASHVECADFSEFGRRPLADPWPVLSSGARVWDVGPFGHKDLFANAHEWLRNYRFDRTVYPNQQVADANLVVSGEPRAGDSVVLAHLYVGLPGLDDSPNAGLSTTPVFWEDTLFTSPTFTAPYAGFRCAFP